MLSLNQFIQDGIHTYVSSQNKNPTFALRLSADLKGIGGDPNQLRRVFKQLIACLVDATQTDSPHIMFETRNVVVPKGVNKSVAQHEYLSPGTYASVLVEVDDRDDSLQLGTVYLTERTRQTPKGHHEAPRAETGRPERKSDDLNPFIWSQIREVIEVHGGSVLEANQADFAPTNNGTALEILLPARNV